MDLIPSLLVTRYSLLRLVAGFGLALLARDAE